MRMCVLYYTINKTVKGTKNIFNRKTINQPAAKSVGLYTGAVLDLPVATRSRSTTRTRFTSFCQPPRVALIALSMSSVFGVCKIGGVSMGCSAFREGALCLRLCDFVYDFATVRDGNRAEIESKSSRNRVEIYPNLSKSIQIYPNLSKSIQIYPNLSKSIQIYPNLSKSIEIYRNRSKSIQIDPNHPNLSKSIEIEIKIEIEIEIRKNATGAS